MIRLLWVLAATMAAATAQPSYDPHGLAAEVRRVQKALQADDPRALSDLPDEWRVDGNYVSTQPLKSAPSREEALAWLEHLAEHLEGFSAPATPDIVQTRKQLESILSRPEFGRARTENGFQRIVRRIRTWIRDFLDRVFRATRDHPTATGFLFWLIVACGVGMLLNWLFRSWRGYEAIAPKRAPLLRIASRTWQEWLAAARKAADTGDSRQAIHCVYWAGVMRLKETGALPADAALTPREYLRRLKTTDPEESLKALTKSLERFWYAERPAQMDDVRASLAHAEALGCKLG